MQILEKKEEDGQVTPQDQKELGKRHKRRSLEPGKYDFSGNQLGEKF